jgi:hypothetical protein
MLLKNAYEDSKAIAVIKPLSFTQITSSNIHYLLVNSTTLVHT